MAEIEASLQRKVSAVDERAGKALPAESSPVRSVADEIAKLRALRDDGALTEEQYAKAIDRTIAGEH